MYKSISIKLKRLAKEISPIELQILSDEEKALLVNKGRELAKAVKKHLEQSKHPLKGFSKDEKRLLLAYIVYVRENITAEEPRDVNEEDAAKILHEEVYKKDTKKETLENALLKQLGKAGFAVAEIK